MKVGDLVRFRIQPDFAVGVIVEIKNGAEYGWPEVWDWHGVGVLWAGLDGKVHWEKENSIIVVNPS
jgi:hypothetical protein